MSQLVLQNVKRQFDEKRGVFGIDLKIEDHEFFVILGPSGCGKTTTLRMVAGLEKVDSGKIFLDDQEITDFPPKMRNIAMVFQNYALYPFMSVRKNIQFPLKIMKMSKKDMDDKTEEMAGILGIKDLLDQKPGEISGGQRQRVALARALVREPKMFLMDEPLSNLDAKLRTQMRVELKRIQKQFGTTTLYVTHDQVEATTLADRALVMRNGRIEQMGPPMDIYLRPENKFVATFVGDPPMNIIPAHLYEEDGKAKLRIEKMVLVLPDLELKPGFSLDVQAGIRPEDVTVGDDGIKAKLTVKQNIGRAEYQYFSLDDGTTFVRQVYSDENIQEGDSLYIRPELNRILLFEDNEGRTIYSSGMKNLRPALLTDSIQQ
ncbi:MAG: ABC transporter ATP-binding protein [Candidatus Thermoplasmatota archaeon]|jgi:multiple sugar transport system ATP-binding protein|nr:ABC transporter ATP-binding protein [Candidatus Thermoplasmatota archaeon]MCL5790702.1 ABC transporter ATP-binding protein [Candidatus Thermoplasmatota archaeon]